jgi:hypothetical protein
VVHIAGSGVDCEDIDLEEPSFALILSGAMPKTASGSAAPVGAALAAFFGPAPSLSGSSGLPQGLGDVHGVAGRDVVQHGLEHVRSQSRGPATSLDGISLPERMRLSTYLHPVGKIADVDQIEEFRAALMDVGGPEDPVDDLGVDVLHVRLDLDEIVLDVADVLLDSATNSSMRSSNSPTWIPSCRYGMGT